MLALSLNRVILQFSDVHLTYFMNFRRLSYHAIWNGDKNKKT